MKTSSSAMAERPRELDQRFQAGVNLRLNYRLKGYLSRHCDMTQFTLSHNGNHSALSCGIKISAVHHLDLSQSTRVTDRRTDRQRDRITTFKTALAYARAVKMVINDGLCGYKRTILCQ